MLYEVITTYAKLELNGQAILEVDALANIYKAGGPGADDHDPSLLCCAHRPPPDHRLDI